MKVFILCGGQGTRLREHTQTRPKPMVEVGGRPLVWHIMKLYAAHGMTDFVLCLGYLGGVIKEYFLNFDALMNDFTVQLGGRREVEVHRGTDQGEAAWRVTLADTGETAMTGARVFRAASRYAAPGETFAVTYGDGVADIDLGRALEHHRRSGRLATITGVRPPSRFGELEVESGKVLAFSEKPQVKQGLINGGFMFLEPGFLDYLSADAGCVLEREPLERCARDGQLTAYEHHGYWQCMDTFRDWESLDRAWRAGAAPWRIWEGER